MPFRYAKKFPFCNICLFKRGLMKIRALRYLISNDKKLFIKFFLNSPFLYSFRYLVSILFSKRKNENGAFLFGVNSLSEFKTLLKDESIPLILGFSYCQKPITCPAPRFSERCLGSLCRKCLISKYIDVKNCSFLSITTVNSLGNKIYEMMRETSSQIIFIISACEMAISMFEDLSKMLNLKGIALPLEKEPCSSFSSFLSAEKGEKFTQTIMPLKTSVLLDELLESRNK